jgi:aldehyde:ferredoxin oxidoreductase
MATGPAGWNGVAYACLTGDRHRNFGRGGAGAVFGSKNLVAVSAAGRRPVKAFDDAAFGRLAAQVEQIVAARTSDSSRTASFRPTTGTTWWLDRAFDGGYMGEAGGYLPWHNFDEALLDCASFARAGTAAFLEIAGRHKVCNRCRHVMCSRTARVESGPFAGEAMRPEFETIALWINCGILDRDAMVYLNRRANDLGVDTMTFGSVMSAAMQLTEQGLLDAWRGRPAFGSAADMMRTLDAIAYQPNDLGRLLAGCGDDIVARAAAGRSPADRDAIATCVTTTFGALGYAGIEPKVFPGMFAAYATSNRGRGDHTYAWTVQAEEGGLSDPGLLAAHVAESQVGKALIDSLGLCDFFAGDIASEPFLGAYAALTGIEYSADDLLACGRRIYALERYVNNLQGRTRVYDAYIHPKLAVPLTAGPHAGKRVSAETHGAILDAYYAYHRWTNQGTVEPRRLEELQVAVGTG